MLEKKDISKPDEEIQMEREIALDVCRMYDIATLYETDELCLYKDGYYIKGIKSFNTIRGYVKDVAKDKEVIRGETTKPYHLNISGQNMIIDFIRGYTYCNIDDFDKDERVINLKNGLYYLDGFLKLKPGKYSSKNNDELEFEKVYFITHKQYINKNKGPYKSFIQIPANYKEGATCEGINKVFSMVFGDSLPLIYEMVGYFIVPTTKYGKAFMFYGPTGTGKTSSLNIILSLIGFENTSGVELQLLDVNFELEKTRNKLLNIFDDLSSKPITFVGNFKKLVTNKWLYGRIKHVQEEARWKNKCKGIFACNDLPPLSKYVTDAFYKRWVLEPCFNVFKELGLENEDIRDKQYSESEMSGLLNKAIEGLKRLEERGNFPDKWQDIEFVKNYWLMDINPVNKFVNDCCELGEDFEIDYDIFYNELCKFRESFKVKEISKNMTTRGLKKVVKNFGVKKVSKKSSAISMYPSGHKYVGIKFRDDYNIEFTGVKESGTILEHLNKRWDKLC